MAYDPSLYNPYGLQMPQQPVNGLVSIDSIEGGEMYPLPPNSVSPPLFLNNENAFIVKRTDGGGAYSLKKYTFAEEELPGANEELYVTKEYFDSQIAEIKEAINGKRIVPEQPAESDEQLDTESDQPG